MVALTDLGWALYDLDKIPEAFAYFSLSCSVRDASSGLAGFAKTGCMKDEITFEEADLAYENPEFGQIWPDVASEIERKRLAKGIYPTLDQISLPVATYKAGMKLNMIDRKWNRAGEGIGATAVKNITAYRYQTLPCLEDKPIFGLANQLMEDLSEFDSLTDPKQFYAA